ncbi:MAG: tryptophan synthase subunit alpha, partial [Muribaculaceae bacterium]|nr:tryptophan synthase subunit alpha [Muribaculaceae bacterium]
MNRLQKLLDIKKKDLLSVYFTAGFPRLDSTGEVIDALCQGGADMIEVG